MSLVKEHEEPSHANAGCSMLSMGKGGPGKDSHPTQPYHKVMMMVLVSIHPITELTVKL